MTHPDEDTLLKFVLETLDEPDHSIVRTHLSVCRECQEIQKRLVSEVTRLQSVGVHVDVPAPPGLPHRWRFPLAVSRWAAVLAAGFLLGYLTANISAPLRTIPVQQRLAPTPDGGDTSLFISCKPVDVSTGSEWVH